MKSLSDILVKSKNGPMYDSQNDEERKQKVLKGTWKCNFLNEKITLIFSYKQISNTTKKTFSVCTLKNSFLISHLMWEKEKYIIK